jgi:hypothetical protein
VARCWMLLSAISEIEPICQRRSVSGRDDWLIFDAGDIQGLDWQSEGQVNCWEESRAVFSTLCVWRECH